MLGHDCLVVKNDEGGVCRWIDSLVLSYLIPW